MCRTEDAYQTGRKWFLDSVCGLSATDLKNFLVSQHQQEAADIATACGYDAGTVYQGIQDTKMEFLQRKESALQPTETCQHSNTTQGLFFTPDAPGPKLAFRPDPNGSFMLCDDCGAGKRITDVTWTPGVAVKDKQ